MNVYDRVVPEQRVRDLVGAGLRCARGVRVRLPAQAAARPFPRRRRKARRPRAGGAVLARVLGLQLAARPASAGAFASDLREFETLRDFFTSASIAALVDLPFLAAFIAAVWLLGGWVALVPARRRAARLGGRAPGAGAARPGGPGQPARRGAVATASWSRRSTAWRRSCLGAEGRTQGAWERLVAAGSPSERCRALLERFRHSLHSLAANLVTVGVVIVGVYQIAAGRLDRGRPDRLQHPRRPRDGAAGPGRGRAQPLPPGSRRPRWPGPADAPAGRAPGRAAASCTVPRSRARSSSAGQLHLPAPEPAGAATASRSRSQPASGSA